MLKASDALDKIASVSAGEKKDIALYVVLPDGSKVNIDDVTFKKEEITKNETSQTKPE